MACYSISQKYLNSYAFGFCVSYFIANLKPQNCNVNSTCLQDIQSWYAQKGQAGSSRIPSLDELQVIELEHDDIPDTEAGAPETETTNAPAQESTPGISISSPRRRTSKHNRTSPAASEKGKKKSCKGSSSEAISETNATQRASVVKMTLRSNFLGHVLVLSSLVGV